MIRPWLFLLIVGGLMAAIVAISNRIPDGDPFMVADADRQVVFDNSWAIAAGKLRHVLAQPPYDVGLFGNSRSLDVGELEIELSKNCRFFNYSLPGESLRASVALLERLSPLGKAPRLAIVSVDNFELQLYSNPYFLGPTARWRLELEDLKAGLLRHDISVTELERMAWRTVIVEIALAKRPFNADLFRDGISLVFGIGSATFATTTTPGRGYRRDGSRTQSTEDGRPPISLSPPNSRQVLPGYLAYDLERLSALRASGVDVVLYESPLDPRSLPASHQPSSIAAETRSAYLAACRSLGLTCHAAPEHLPGDGGKWRDNNHAPAAVLGRYIALMLAGKAGVCHA